MLSLFFFFLLFLFLFPDWLIWTANQNTHWNGQKLADYRTEQYIVSALIQETQTQRALACSLLDTKQNMHSSYFSWLQKWHFFPMSWSPSWHMQQLWPVTAPTLAHLGQFALFCLHLWLLFWHCTCNSITFLILCQENPSAYSLVRFRHKNPSVRVGKKIMFWL